jgi:hypothetical protein
LVASEVRRIREPSGKSVGDADARVSCNELAQSVPVAAVESLNVRPEQRRELRRHLAARHTRRRRRDELRATAMQRGLHTADGGVEKFRDLLERVVEHVLQQHARALLRR